MVTIYHSVHSSTTITTLQQCKACVEQLINGGTTYSFLNFIAHSQNMTLHCMYDVVVKRSRLLSHLLMRACLINFWMGLPTVQRYCCNNIYFSSDYLVQNFTRRLITTAKPDVGLYADVLRCFKPSLQLTTALRPYEIVTANWRVNLTELDGLNS